MTPDAALYQNRPIHFLPVSQSWPVYPATQSHVRVSPVSLQVPPLPQGVAVHSCPTDNMKQFKNTTIPAFFYTNIVVIKIISNSPCQSLTNKFTKS